MCLNIIPQSLFPPLNVLELQNLITNYDVLGALVLSLLNIAVNDLTLLYRFRFFRKSVNTMIKYIYQSELVKAGSGLHVAVVVRQSVCI